jgi:hypothetical protein
MTEFHRRLRVAWSEFAAIEFYDQGHSAQEQGQVELARSSYVNLVQTACENFTPRPPIPQYPSEHHAE